MPIRSGHFPRFSHQLTSGKDFAQLRAGRQSHPNAVHRISEVLKQEDGEQTRRMAMTILANAFVFHENLAGGASPELAEVRSLAQLRSSPHGLTKSEVLMEWKKILRVNYLPIFEIARRILETIPTGGSKVIVSGLAEPPRS